MLKIKDSSGKLVGVLKDEDSSPEMKVEPEEETTEEGESDGDSNNGDV
jgi:hypothetical protein